MVQTLFAFGLVAVVLFAVITGYLGNVYNKLVTLEERVREADQNIDVLLKQRQNELEKLIDTAEEYMEYEEELLQDLTEAREEAERAATPTEKAEADQMVRDVISDFRARAEEYPELKSQGNMLQLQERISELETQISDRREFYNQTVAEYNSKLRQYPYVMFAKQIGYDEAEYFTAAPDEKRDIDVSNAFG